MGGVMVAVYAIVACLRGAEPKHIELFHIYYQPLIVCLAMLWMWGADVNLFERRRIAYAVCFSAADQQRLLSSQQIFQVWAVSQQARLSLPPPKCLCAQQRGVVCIATNQHLHPGAAGPFYSQ